MRYKGLTYFEKPNAAKFFADERGLYIAENPKKTEWVVGALDDPYLEELLNIGWKIVEEYEEDL